MTDVVIVGFGGHALSVVDSVMRTGQFNIIGYTDRKPTQYETQFPYLGSDDVLEKLYKDAYVKCAILGIGYMGKGTIRKDIFEKLKAIGYEFPVIIDPSAIVSESAIVEEGCFVGKHSVVNAYAHLGKMCIVNTGAIVEHECKVEDFSHVAVGATLCGQVCVGKECLIGANATVIQCQKIQDNEIVPAGQTVRRRNMDSMVNNILQKKIGGGVQRTN